MGGGQGGGDLVPNVCDQPRTTTTTTITTTTTTITINTTTTVNNNDKAVQTWCLMCDISRGKVKDTFWLFMDIKKDPCLFKYDQLPVSMRNLEIHKVTIRRGEGEKTKGDCYAAYPSLSSYTLSK